MRVIKTLSEKPTTRQAVVQILDAEDISEQHKNVPCTCTLQFFARGRRLHMVASMRSNDAYIGLPHDVFAFTMIQEIVARALRPDAPEQECNPDARRWSVRAGVKLRQRIALCR